MRYASLIQIAGAAAIAALMAAPVSERALAQTQAASGATDNGSMPLGIGLGGGAEVDEATKEKRREIERAYKDATHNIPAQQAATNDPWANMRGDEAKPAAKPAAKTAQKKKPAQ